MPWAHRDEIVLENGSVWIISYGGYYEPEEDESEESDEEDQRTDE